jgi:AAA+ superfamily predicted ATPase
MNTNKILLIEKMCAADPKNAELLYLLGIEYREAGVFEKAVEAFSDALKNAQGDLFDKILKELSEIRAKKPAGVETESSRPDKADCNSFPTTEDGLSDASETVYRGSGYLKDAADNSDDMGDMEGFEADGPDESNDPEEEFDNTADDEVAKFRMLRGGNSAKTGNSKPNSLSDIKFDDVGGLDDLKSSIRMKIIKPFLTPGLFERFKKKSGGGLLLFGPPGCGKTFIARATAGECSAVFKPVHITDVLDPYFGQSAQNIKDIFSVARAQKPCILFFDEIDTIGFNRAKSSTDMMRSIVDQLLSEIEGIDSNTERILIIGATNMPWDVDPALRRPGRFDRTIFVPPPDVAAREVIFRLKMQGRPCENIDYRLLARETELFSGADIENVIETATENVLEEILSTGDERKLKQEDLLKALKSARPSTIEWLRTISNYVKYANQSGVYSDVEAYLSKHRKLL